MRLAAFSLLLIPLLPTQPAVAATLSVCTEASPEGFGVVQYNSLTTINVSADMLINHLVEFDAGKGAVVPSLVERWSVSDGGLSYHFDLRQSAHLRSAAYFKPNRTLDADGVVFSLQRMLNPANPQHKAAQDGFPHTQLMQLPELIKRVEKSGNHQVPIVLSHPDAIFLPMLSMGFASIYSMGYTDQLIEAGTPEKLNTAPIDSGPFVFKCFQKDTVVRYTAGPECFTGKPAVDALILAITPDASVCLQKLRRSKCQIVLSPKPLDVGNTRKNVSLKVEQTPAFMTALAAPNIQHPPLDDPKARQAINLAFDCTGYLQTISKGSASAATDIYPPNIWSYARDISAYPHDPEQARKLLAGRQLPELNIWTRPSDSLLNPSLSLSAQLLQASLAETRIKASIRVIEWGELIRRAKNGKHDLLSTGWIGDNGDSDSFLTPRFSCASVRSGLSFARYCSPGLDRLIIDGKAASNQEQRTDLYHQAQKLIHEQALWLSLVYPTTSVLTRREVQGYQVNPLGHQDFSRVAVER